MYEILMNGKKSFFFENNVKITICNNSEWMRKFHIFIFFFVEMYVKITICRKFEISKNQHVFAVFSQYLKNLIFEKKIIKKFKKKSLFTIDNVILIYLHEKSEFYSKNHFFD